MNLMNYNCLAAIVFGLFGYTLIGSAADALFKIAPQTTIANLDPVADRSRGSLKWSNGAFLFKEATGAAAPIFHTLDREGRLVSSFTLRYQEPVTSGPVDLIEPPTAPSCSLAVLIPQMGKVHHCWPGSQAMVKLKGWYAPERITCTS